jgi:hypothetical protein
MSKIIIDNQSDLSEIDAMKTVMRFLEPIISGDDNYAKGNIHLVLNYCPVTHVRERKYSVYLRQRKSEKSTWSFKVNNIAYRKGDEE